MAAILAAGCGRAMAQSAPAQSMPDDGADTRTPLPLLPMMAQHQKANMREHLQVVEQIVAASAVNDFARIADAASKIGYSDEEAMMCSHMGAATPGFTEVAIRFHKTADKIAEAAHHKDKKGVMTALDATLKECVGCHAVYRQKIVDEATWKKMTGMAAPAMHHH